MVKALVWLVVIGIVFGGIFLLGAGSVDSAKERAGEITQGQWLDGEPSN